MSSSLTYNQNSSQQHQLTNVSKSINNTRANKLAADYKQIILELSKNFCSLLKAVFIIILKFIYRSSKF